MLIEKARGNMDLWQNHPMRKIMDIDAGYVFPGTESCDLW